MPYFLKKRNAQHVTNNTELQHGAALGRRNIPHGPAMRTASMECRPHPGNPEATTAGNVAFTKRKG